MKNQSTFSFSRYLDGCWTWCPWKDSNPLPSVLEALLYQYSFTGKINTLHLTSAGKTSLLRGVGFEPTISGLWGRQDDHFSTPQFGGLNENRTRPYGVTGRCTNRYTIRPLSSIWWVPQDSNLWCIIVTRLQRASFAAWNRHPVFQNSFTESTRRLPSYTQESKERWLRAVTITHRSS